MESTRAPTTILVRNLEPSTPPRVTPLTTGQYRWVTLSEHLNGRADIDLLDKVYLRLLVPTATALLSAATFIAILAAYRPRLALAEGALLAIAGALVPWLAYRFGRRPSRRLVETAAQMRAGLVDDLQGMGELLVYGAEERQAERLRRVSSGLADAHANQKRPPRSAAAAARAGRRQTSLSIQATNSG